MYILIGHTFQKLSLFRKSVNFSQLVNFQTKRFKLAHQKSDSSLKSEEIDDLEIGDSSSLPSSQEEFESKIKREVSLKDTDQEDSEYESAEEK